MFARLFHLFVWVLLIGPLSAPGWATVRPETRVAGSRGFSSAFTSPSTSQVAESHPENPACVYDFASGVGIYLYASANPVMMTDPSGHFSEGLTGLLVGMSQRFTAWTMSGSVAAKGFGYAMATLNVVAFVSDPGAYMSMGPLGSPEILAADVANLLRVGNGLFRATRSAVAARDGFKILSAWRTDMRIPQVGQAGGDDVTTALLEVHDSMWIGSRFKGRSPNDPSSMHPSLRPNAITRQHAEADAFNQAAWSGVTAERATLTVDRALCRACGRSGGVKSMAKALGIKELTIVTPAGKDIIAMTAL